MHVRNLGYPSPYKSGAQKTTFSAITQLKDKFNGLYPVLCHRNSECWSGAYLQAGEQLRKLFAFDQIKYKRLWPRYIKDMHDLRTNHFETWEELQAGNIAVTKNDIFFVSIGANNACQHRNKFILDSSAYRTKPMLDRGSSWSHQNSPVLQKSSRVTLTWNLTKPESIMTLAKCCQEGAKDQTLSTRSRQHTETWKAMCCWRWQAAQYAYIPDEYVPMILM